MQQLMNTNSVQVVVFAEPEIIDKQSIYKNMKSGLARQLIGLGVVQVLIGILCMIFQAISMGVGADGRYFFYGLDLTGYGLWIGLMVSNKCLECLARNSL